MSRGKHAARDAADAAAAGWDPDARRRTFLALCVLPALAVLLLALVYPLFYNVLLSLSDANIYRIRDWRVTGFDQYLLVLRDPEFWIVFGKTVVWTTVCTLGQVAIGIALAVVLHQNFIVGRPAWRMILLLPWAVPQYITALTWRGLFHGETGAVNLFLGSAFGLAPVDWLNSPPAAFAAAMLVNVWMGFPFMMIVALVGLRGIPAGLYEVAMLEGAPPWAQFTRITAPLLRSVMLPATALGIVWNFNSLNVIWLFSDGGEPSGSTQILASYVYEAAFTHYRFGWSAALSVVIFAILFFAVQGFLQTSRWRR